MHHPSPITNSRVVVLGEEDKCAHMYGGAFDHLGVHPIWFLPGTDNSVLEHQPDIVLTSLEWAPAFRVAVGEAKRAGIPVIYVVDGVIEWDYIWHNDGFVKPDGTVLQPLLADRLCVVGRHQARILAALGLARKIQITGIPRLDGFPRVRKPKAGGRPRIVVTTARTYGHNCDHKASTETALASLKAFFDCHADIEAVWRIPDDLSSKLQIASHTGGTMENTLAEADALISFPSTCVLEGMLMGLPTAAIDFRPVPQLVETAWTIRSPQQISPVVQELLQPPAEKMAYQAFCLDEELEAEGAANRLASVIAQAVDGDGLPDSQPVETASPNPEGALDFRLVHPQISTFSMSDTAQLQYELDGTYKLLQKARGELKETLHRLEKLEHDNRHVVVKLARFISRLPGRIGSLFRRDRIES